MRPSNIYGACFLKCSQTIITNETLGERDRMVGGPNPQFPFPREPGCLSSCFDSVFPPQHPRGRPGRSSPAAAPRAAPVPVLLVSATGLTSTHATPRPPASSVANSFPVPATSPISQAHLHFAVSTGPTLIKSSVCKTVPVTQAGRRPCCRHASRGLRPLWPRTPKPWHPPTALGVSGQPPGWTLLGHLAAHSSRFSPVALDSWLLPLMREGPASLTATSACVVPPSRMFFPLVFV